MTAHATVEGTLAFRDRFAGALASDHFAERRGLWFSSIGLGTYLGEPDALTDNLYREAIARAVELGCNVIDTAVNYRFQRSERSVGAALAELFETGRARREELIVCTKGGYIPFDSDPPADPSRWMIETLIAPGIVQPDDIIGMNVMTPTYIRHQMDTSLSNLRLSAIDVYYLHNPEQQLDRLPAPQVYARIRACFEALERAVEAGRIGVYGVATWNGFRTSEGARGHLDLETLVGLARQVAGEQHHFAVVQLPFNLAMPEAFVADTQRAGGRSVPALQAAADLGLTAITSAALLQSQLADGLPEGLRQKMPGTSTDAQRAIEFARSTPGVTAALVGMKSAAHVAQNLALARLPKLTAAQYQALYE